MTARTPTVALIGTLDTKGVEIAYVRDRLLGLGTRTLVIDSGILGEPAIDCADISREQVATAAGTTLAALRLSPSRGAAIERMREGVRRTVLDGYTGGAVQGVLCLGGSEGAVMGAYAMAALPIGVPKLIVSPTASGRRTFGPLVGSVDTFVLHSVVDILGINAISRVVYDNAAAAMAGMVRTARPMAADPAAALVALTMLGNTTTAVMHLLPLLEVGGYQGVIFHANGVGGVGCRRWWWPAASISPPTVPARRSPRRCAVGPATTTTPRRRWSGSTARRWPGSAPCWRRG